MSSAPAPRSVRSATILVRMEAIIGSECCYANIQNDSAWGAWEGEGRSFRYLVTYIRNARKRSARPGSMTSSLKRRSPATISSAPTS